VPNEEGDEYLCEQVSELQRWDGTSWRSVELPGPGASVLAMTVADDGAGWAAFSDGSIGRYADGRWTRYETGAKLLGPVVPAPDGRACVGTFERPSFLVDLLDAITCFGEEGQSARYDLGGLGAAWTSGGGGPGFSVAPDGAVWILGAQVARLTDALPAVRGG
jgi:hypothetical protein